MTAPRNVDNLIRTFLDEGLVELPDRAYDAVRRDINRTRQRVRLGPWSEPSVSALARLALAAAVIVAVSVAWFNFGPPSYVGNPPTPAPAPTASPAPVTGDNRALDPGRYYFEAGFAPGSTRLPGTKIYVTVPGPGWTNYANFALDHNYGLNAGPSFVVWNIVNVYRDPCTDHGPNLPAPGQGIDELLEALADQNGIDAGPITDVTIDGFPGKYVDLTITADISTCADGFFTWGSSTDGRFAQDNNELDRVYALEVGGERLTFFLRIPQRTTADDRTLLLGMVDSIDIEP